jgi:hypothetical protein
MSRLSLSAPAEREARPARILLSGLPGSGLTLTALTLAHTLAAGDQFLVIDTERRTALTYADLFPFEHIPWAAPYRPTELAEDVFEGARRWPVVVVDTLTRFWTDTGGIRDVADGVGMSKQAPQGWDAARPMHRTLMAALTEARAHVIVTCRTRVETVAGVDPTGGPVVEVLPGGIQQDDTVWAEMDVHLRLDAVDHAARVWSSRIPTIRQGALHPTFELEALAETYREWCAEGARMADLDDVQLIAERLGALYPDDRTRRAAAKQRFATALGLPQHLRARQLPDALALVTALEDEAKGHGDPAGRAQRLAGQVAADRAGARAGKDAAAEQEGVPA